MAWMQSHGNFSHPEVISYELLEGEVFNSKFCINPLEPISMAIESCACHIEYEIAEEAMNFMSYVAEVSRGWDEPNAKDMGIMKSQPNAKGEMCILNDGIDMKAKIVTMARRLEELEMKKMQEVQAISHTPLQAMPCAICLSYEHLVEECPTISAPPQYKQHVQETQQASNLEQAMVNLSKVMGDFVGAQKSINAHLSQRIDSVESSLNKRMDEVQNDLSQKIDNLQDSISRRKCKNDERKGREERILAIGSVATLGHILEHFLESISYILIPFRSSGSQESNSSNGIQIGVETKKLWSLQENWTELSGNFAHLNPRCEKFRTVRNTSWHTSAISHTSSPFSHRAKQGAKISHTTIQGAKISVQGASISHTSIQGAKNFCTVRNTLLAHECHFAHLKPIFAWCETRCEFLSPKYGNFARCNSRCEILILRCENFATVGHNFEALPGAQIMHMICNFKDWEVRNPALQTVCDLDLKQRSYGRLKTTMQS
uniref:Uncharacterized protein n=1 Tax=Vitis vinifera TaxID=29760 RepID=A5ATY9_VITVI|nr:hypothetical protein VITISV_006688 [Vitis vinifera]